MSEQVPVEYISQSQTVFDRINMLFLRQSQTNIFIFKSFFFLIFK